MAAAQHAEVVGVLVQFVEVHVVGDVREQADGQQVTVERVYGPGTGMLRADPTQMEQMFLNLIYNALQAMEDGGTLTVTTRDYKMPEIRLTLADQSLAKGWQASLMGLRGAAA